VPPLPVESAAGVRLRLADGRELVTGFLMVGRDPRLPPPGARCRRRDQLGRMSHVMFGGLTHEPGVRLAARLVELTPAPLRPRLPRRLRFVSVEVAVKMCLQYWPIGWRPGKRRLLTWRGGYHGDTFHPMSVCDPDGGMHSLWRRRAPEQVFAPAPPSVSTPASTDHAGTWVDLIERHRTNWPP